MIRLAIDIGSYQTKIYMPGCGVVLAESTCVAVEEDADGLTVKAFGDRARALSGKSARNTRIVNPVREGDIVRPELLAELLLYFFEKIEIPRRKIKTCEVMFLLPCGAGEELREKYLDLSYDVGIGRTCFTFTPFAAVLGHNVSLSETVPVFCLDIGYGITNIAAVSLDGIISGLSVNLGGGNIDVSVIDFMAEEHKLKIGTLTAERIKNVVGSLLEDDNKMMVADGRSAEDGSPMSAAVNSSAIEGVIALYVDKILEYVNIVIKDLPAEVVPSVMHGGVYLSGGLAKLDGLAEYISKKLGVPVNQSPEPSLCAVMGCGMILSSDYLRAALATS